MTKVTNANNPKNNDINDVNVSVIEEFLDYYGLVCLNDGKGRYNSTQNTESVRYWTLTSTVIAGISTWEEPINSKKCSVPNNHQDRNRPGCIEMEE